MRTPALLATVAALVMSCGPATPAGPTWHQDIKPLVDARCVSCHVPGGLPPFALDTYAAAKAQAQAMSDAVAAGRMPPWGAGTADVTYLHDPSLTPAQKQALADWAAHGAPEGDPKKPGAALPGVGGGLERVDATVQVPTPYTPVPTPRDDYRCFPVAWPEAKERYVTGVNAVPGVLKEVHHVALYIVPPDSAQLPFQWDAEDARPGYSCFGGPFGSRPQTFAVNLLAAWIPGSKGLTLERGGGVAVPAGATLVLQMHYNVEGFTPLPDQTRLDFSLADTVERKMAYQPFLDAAWVAGEMKIPAGQAAVSFAHEADPRSFFQTLGSPLDNSRGFNIEAVMFHMHKLGAQGRVDLVKADHSVVRILDLQRWDFHWQLEYHLVTPVRFEPGDHLRMRCTFDNSAAHQNDGAPPKDTNWGEGSDDEMCVANILSSE